MTDAVRRMVNPTAVAAAINGTAEIVGAAETVDTNCSHTKRREHMI